MQIIKKKTKTLKEGDIINKYIKQMIDQGKYTMFIY